MDPKSYSGSIVSDAGLRPFFIESPLSAPCGTRTDDANCLAFLGVADDEQSLPRRYANREESPLRTRMSGIRERRGQRIVEDARCFVEVDSVLPLVPGRLRGIPLEDHLRSIGLGFLRNPF
jgi:hypothetical protein